MKYKQKQIEEMAYSICGVNKKLIKSCRECPIFQEYKHPCVKKEVAEEFYNAGCRMQSDTAREILQRLYDMTKNHYGNKIILKSGDIKELAAQYGVEVEE